MREDYTAKIAEVMKHGVEERSNSNYDLDGYLIYNVFERSEYDFEESLPEMEFDDLRYVRYDQYNEDGKLEAYYIQHWFKDILLDDYLSYDRMTSTPVSVSGVTVSIRDENAIDDELINECALYILNAIDNHLN